MKRVFWRILSLLVVLALGFLFAEIIFLICSRHQLIPRSYQVMALIGFVYCVAGRRAWMQLIDLICAVIIGLVIMAIKNRGMISHLPSDRVQAILIWLLIFAACALAAFGVRKAFSYLKKPTPQK